LVTGLLLVARLLVARLLITWLLLIARLLPVRLLSVLRRWLFILFAASEDQRRKAREREGSDER